MGAILKLGIRPGDNYPLVIANRIRVLKGTYESLLGWNQVTDPCSWQSDHAATRTGTWSTCY